ncbi:MAG: TetR/AcrR family transcriptional regulator [Deltaproteobacteria bacterium]|nr:TetR/AcrR family transcriptional regulator [Deltaproteobacteria bacterium]
MPRIPTKQAAKLPRPPVKKKRKLIRLDNDERHAQLLAIGRVAFSTTSYDEVSIDELARKAKLSKGLFYYYFPTKRDLYIAGLRETAQELVAKLVKDVPTNLPPRERAIAGVEAYLGHVASHGLGFVALMRGGIGSDPQVAAVLESVRTGVIDEFLQGAPVSAVLKARPLSRIAIRSWIGMVEAASIEWLSTREVPREQVRDLLVDALFDMLVRVLDPKDAQRYQPS